MISSEVQRTLVKSPPELWAELSDPDALARHLGELGDVRIVRTEPEETIEWAAENTAGTVSIQPSGWGTKVTLSVTRQIAEQALAAEAPSEADATPEAAAEPVLEPKSTAELAPEPTSQAEPEPASTTEAEPVDVAEPEPEVDSQPRRGFFARLFGRLRRTEPPEIAEQPASAEPPAPPDAFAAVREVLAPETFAAEHPFAALPETTPAPDASASEQETPAGQMSDLSAELMAAEEAGTEEVTAVLTAVLDRLGAAHHRPFSRA